MLKSSCFFVLVVVLGIVAGGCGQRAMYGSAAPAEMVGMYDGGMTMGKAAEFAPEGVPGRGAMRVATEGAPMNGGGDVLDKPTSLDRKIVYTGSIGLRVANKRATAARVEQLIEDSDGFIARSSLDEIVFRVKPDQFEAVMTELEQFGEVVSREISSEDITAQYMDVELRMETAEKSRRRLMDLLQNAKETKDVLEIERDIRRLTEEIERMKGQLRVMGDRVDYATITVRIEEKVLDQVASPHRSQGSPFPWIRETGIEKTLAYIYSDAPLRYKRGVVLRRSEFELAGQKGSPAPEGFVPLEHRRDLLFAATAEDFRLRARAVELRQENTIEFWLAAVLSDLVDNRGYVIAGGTDSDGVIEFPMEQKDLAVRQIPLETIYGGETWLYDIWLVQEGGADDEIVVVEYARLKSEGETGMAEVAAAVEGMKVR